MALTANQEDYLEAIWELSPSGEGARTTDIAERLGCRLPTVSRTVRKLAEIGMVEHESRGLVRLTPQGRSTAADIAHRHRDTEIFLIKILGLTRSQAQRDARQIEHGLSPIAAQRLHEFLEYVERLSPRDRKVLTEFARTASLTAVDFPNLMEGKSAGWRG
jgi:Mn-dependent DtxR family transcriptional regulator